jgi:rhodanese-related sulfurtransferase
MKNFLTLILFLVSISVQAEVNHINNAQLESLIKSGVPVIDVRRTEEWRQTGIVEGSHLITFFDANGRYDVKSWLNQLDKIAKSDEPFILICRTGNRTGTISNFLDKKLGYSKVYNVQKGIAHWISKGNKTVKPVM